MGREQRRLLREVTEESTAEPGRYGCPMLSRVRSTLPNEPVGAVWRCSLGWAVFGDLVTARCMATEDANDCWRVHPERTPVTVLPGAEASELKIGAD